MPPKQDDKTFYWFDYETFGISPAWDKPAQFAGQRTTIDLEPVGEPIILYCKPPADYLPHPEACRVTQMMPDEISRRGTNEPEFIKAVLAELGKPGTCSVGYNNIRFDDEFTRHTLFRNFRDPYEYEWKDGNSRWDLLDIVRLARALRPDGINWPVTEEGVATNRLEVLSVANGIEHTHAHDALSDVEATIGMAKLLKQAQPKLFDFAFNNRDKNSVAAMLNYQQRKPCLHISGMVPGTVAHTSLVSPIIKHPENNNGVIVLDMRTDPAELADLTTEQIAARVFAKEDELNGEERIHLRTIQINKCPVVVPVQTMRPEDAERLEFDLQQQSARAEKLNAIHTKEFANKIQKVMIREWEKTTDDVDGSLYSGGFFSSDDKKSFAKIQATPANQLKQFEGYFDDERLDEMLLRYRARNFPETLNAEEKTDWEAHIKERLHDDKAPWLTASKFKEAMEKQDWKEEEARLRESLERHAKMILKT